MGREDTGKTSILIRFINDTFKKECTTVGMNFKTKVMYFPNKRINLQIWDPAGAGTRFDAISSAYYKDVDYFLVVYDITNKDSFLDVENQLKECDKYGKKDAIRILVGSKSDLSHQRKISYEEADLYAKNNRMKFFETSAKYGFNVDNLFDELSKEIAGKFQSKEEKYINEGKISLSHHQSKKNTCF